MNKATMLRATLEKLLEKGEGHAQDLAAKLQEGYPVVLSALSWQAETAAICAEQAFWANAILRESESDEELLEACAYVVESLRSKLLQESYGMNKTGFSAAIGNAELQAHRNLIRDLEWYTIPE